MDYSNHYKVGLTMATHKGKNIASSLNSSLSDFFSKLESLEFEVGYIPAGYEHRPDLISNLFYNTVTLDWLICMFNNVSDPLQQLNVNDRILIPKF